MTNHAQPDRKAVVEALNSLEVIEYGQGEDGYLLVENSEKNRSILNAVGISDETIMKYGDEETFCIMMLGFKEGYADQYDGGRLQCFDDSIMYKMNQEKGQAIMFYKLEGKVWMSLHDGTEVLVCELDEEKKKALMRILE